MKPEAWQNQVPSRLSELKNKKFGEIAIPCDFSGHSYRLVLLTADCALDTNLMSLVSSWRKKHEFWFQAQFPVTVDRTISWFKKRVIETPDRVLFVVEVDGKYIGHVGLFRFDFARFACEIDNIVRGEGDVLPGIIGDAVKSLMEWGREDLGILGYTLQTTSDNERALRLYHRLGFVETKRVPLFYNKTEEGGEWLEAPAGFTEPIKRYDVFMELKELTI